MAAYRTNASLSSHITDLIYYLIVAFLLRSSVCTSNDIFDREIDASVGKFCREPDLYT